jgi:hypothetical protein
MMRESVDDYLTATRKRPPMLTFEQAVTLRRPRRCNVPWHRQGGALCCDQCVNQVFGGVPLRVFCAASEDPPLFRPRSREE